MLTEAIARKLNMEPQELERQSLRTYLEARRRHVEADLFLLAKKHGVRTLEEFDTMVKEGKIREADGFEDFFTLDRLEAERDMLTEALKGLP